MNHRPTPIKQGITFTWSFFPPGPPIKPGDQIDHTLMIDWSLQPPGPPTKQGVLFSWNIIPPGPCKSGDQSCPPGPPVKQGFAIDWDLIPPGPPDKQPFNIDFFPNGFDPSIGGFTQIENQPGGSSPGDMYGFTQIENQPLGGQVAINFTLPAVQ